MGFFIVEVGVEIGLKAHMDIGQWPVRLAGGQVSATFDLGAGLRHCSQQ